MKKIKVQAYKDIERIRLADGQKHNVKAGDIVEIYEHKFSRYRGYGFQRVSVETTELKKDPIKVKKATKKKAVAKKKEDKKD